MKNLYCIIIMLAFFSCSTKKASIEEINRLKTEINGMYDLDQQFARLPFGKYLKYPTEKSWQLFEKSRDSINEIHVKKAEAILKKYGYPGINLVGEETSQKFFIIPQHADKNVLFQQKVLQLMKKELEKNNIKKANYAYLLDRVRKNLKQKQYYGTQVEYNKKGQATPLYGLEDSLHVEQRRKDMGMEPLLEYLNNMTLMHYQMNKEILEKQNILEPQLYKN